MAEHVNLKNMIAGKTGLIRVYAQNARQYAKQPITGIEYSDSGLRFGKWNLMQHCNNVI